MLVIIASLLAGYIIGYLTRRHLVKKTPAIINALIWLLLLLMGWEVGSTPNLAESLSTLGEEALILTIASVTGGIAASYLLWKVINRNKEKEHK